MLFDDEGLPTKTSDDQKATERAVATAIEFCGSRRSLTRGDHAHFLGRSLRGGLSAAYQSLDASQPWLCYWTLNALSLLGDATEAAAGVDAATRTRVVKTLRRCVAASGGYGGGRLQTPHLAPTYAAVRALVACGTDAALASIDVAALGAFLRSLKRPDGSFAAHSDGEVDMRGAYCALSTAAIVGVLDAALADNAAGWIASCQTHEGGIAGVPGSEAHGGYTFCGVAALAVIGRLDAIDANALLRWLLRRQMPAEGGFCGRANKLVDSCYTFWQGAALAIVARHLGIADVQLVDAQRLQEYVLCAAQDERGGLRDKPGKGRDLYHTCYALSGLSVVQNILSPASPPFSEEDRLEQVDPVHGVRKDRLEHALAFFASRQQEKKKQP